MSRVIIIFRGQSTHAVEHDRAAPVLQLPRPAEHDVVLAELDLLHAHADRVRARRASTRHRVRQPLQLERRRQHRRHGRPHGPRHAVGADLLELARAHRVQRLADVRDARATLPEDAAGARVVLVGLLGQLRVLDGVVHGQKRILRVVAHKSGAFSINNLADRLFIVKVELGPSGDLGLHADLGVLGHVLDAAPRVVEAVGDVVERVA
mmetsp:Transcript_1712/g.4896  ORF Transcript_1712/g.4896 Transcript_1712/m.4896 type:complete len:208 (+) Transcript_1712:640-1263(+)